jgi:NAD(P)-dependent dehydrogenase (short-subunit alcohol dehydrogenase family)
MQGQEQRSSRSAVTVGACGGIGRATAKALAACGFRLTLLDQAEAELEALRGELGPDTGIEVCSITEGEQVRTAFDRIRSNAGCDVLVNAAGIHSYAPISELSESDWRRTIDVNLTGLFLVCQAATPLLAQSRNARIVNVLSIAATQTFARQSAYCASKWGGLALSRVLAEEVRPLGIAVTNVHPGAVDTPLWDHSIAPFRRESMLRPEQVADVIAFIARQPAGVRIDDITISAPAGIL